MLTLEPVLLLEVRHSRFYPPVSCENPFRRFSESRNEGWGRCRKVQLVPSLGYDPPNLGYESRAYTDPLIIGKYDQSMNALFTLLHRHVDNTRMSYEAPVPYPDVLLRGGV